MGELHRDELARRRERLMALPFRTPGSRLLAEAWLDFAGGNLAPARGDVDPARLAGILPNIVILEYLDGGRIDFRLAGTDFFTTFDREITGESYLDLFPEDERPATRERLFSLVRRPCGLLALLGSRNPEASPDRLESFGLPLRNRQGETTLTIHHADYPDRIEDIARISMRQLQALEAAWVDIGHGVPDAAPPL